MFLRNLQRKNGVLGHTDLVFQRSLSPPGFVRQDREVISFKKHLLLARSAMRRASISINSEHLGDLTLALLSVAGQVSAGRDSVLSAHPADAGRAGAPLPAGRPPRGAAGISSVPVSAHRSCHGGSSHPCLAGSGKLGSSHLAVLEIPHSRDVFIRFWRSVSC